MTCKRAADPSPGAVLEPGLDSNPGVKWERPTASTFSGQLDQYYDEEEGFNPAGLSCRFILRRSHLFMPCMMSATEKNTFACARVRAQSCPMSLLHSRWHTHQTDEWIDQKQRFLLESNVGMADVSRNHTRTSSISLSSTRSDSSTSSCSSLLSTDSRTRQTFVTLEEIEDIKRTIKAGRELQ